MNCPKCKSPSRVTDKRTRNGITRRTRYCSGGHKFLTLATDGAEVYKPKTLAPSVKSRLERGKK